MNKDLDLAVGNVNFMNDHRLRVLIVQGAVSAAGKLRLVLLRRLSRLDLLGIVLC